MQNSDLILVSDVHLDQLQSPKGRLLLDLIARCQGAQIGSFVLLGDIFDFCMGSSPYYQRLVADLGTALGKLAGQGTEVWYFEGNHEIDSRYLGWEGVRFVPSGNQRLQLRDGTKIRLAHGDMIYSHWRYKAFRKTITSAPVRFLIRQLPGEAIHSIAVKSSHVSRAADQYRTIDHKAILKAADDWLDQSDCDHGIFGHFHVPYAQPRKKGQGLLMSVDCWWRPNALVYRDGGFHRLWLEEDKLVPIEISSHEPLPDF